MDEVLLRDVQGFLRSLSEKCKVCHFRGSAECRNCDATFAGGLYRRMTIVPGPTPEDEPQTETAIKRKLSVIAQLKKAGRPLLAAEIVCEGSNPSTKAMMLRRMVGKEIRRRRRNGKYIYILNS